MLTTQSISSTGIWAIPFQTKGILVDIPSGSTLELVLEPTKYSIGLSHPSPNNPKLKNAQFEKAGFVQIGSNSDFMIPGTHKSI